MNDVVIRPLRFTDDVQAMRAFLETLGLRSRIESERGLWVDMVAGRGMVALHDAASNTSGAGPGETRLAFEADDIDELKDRLDGGRLRGRQHLRRGVRPGADGKPVQTARSCGSMNAARISTAISSTLLTRMRAGR